MSLTELYGYHQNNHFEAEAYDVDASRVLGLQALLMTELRPVAKTHRQQHTRPPKITGFVFLQEGNHIDYQGGEVSDDELKQQLYDGSIDTYFGVMARRLSPRERRLTVSVLNHTFNGDNLSTRSIHQLSWRSDSQMAQGTRRDVMASSDRELLMSSAVDGRLELMQSGDDNRIVMPITPSGNDFEELEQQVYQIVDTIKSKS